MPAELDETLAFLAERDDVPVATKTLRLIKMAIEIDEDDILNEIAAVRKEKAGKLISHKDAWK